MMTQIVVRLPYEEKEQFMKVAVRNDITMSQLVRWLIRSINERAEHGLNIDIR